MKKLMKKSVALLVGTLTLAAVAGVAQAETRFAVQDVNATDKMVVTDQGKIGIGTVTPGSGITIKTNDQFVAQIRNHYTGDISAASAGVLLVRNTTTGTPLKDYRLGYMLFGGVGADGNDKNGAGLVSYAEADWTPASFPSYVAVETTLLASRTEKLRITGGGDVGIGTATPKSKLHVVGIPVYVNNAAAIAGGLTAGAFYRTGADPDLLCIVH